MTMRSAHVGTKKTEIGIEIHLAATAFVRRMFEHLGYKVTRSFSTVYFAGLTNSVSSARRVAFPTPRGRCRHCVPDSMSDRRRRMKARNGTQSLRAVFVM